MLLSGHFHLSPNGEQPEVENRKQTNDVGREPSVVCLHDPSAIKKNEFLYVDFFACLLHHFPPEISIALKNGWLVSGTSQGRRTGIPFPVSGRRTENGISG
jgi:hypothetical protein